MVPTPATFYDCLALMLVLGVGDAAHRAGGVCPIPTRSM